MNAAKKPSWVFMDPLLAVEARKRPSAPLLTASTASSSPPDSHQVPRLVRKQPRRQQRQRRQAASIQTVTKYRACQVDRDKLIETS